MWDPLVVLLRKLNMLFQQTLWPCGMTFTNGETFDQILPY